MGLLSDVRKRLFAFITSSSNEHGDCVVWHFSCQAYVFEGVFHDAVVSSFVQIYGICWKFIICALHECVWIRWTQITLQDVQLCKNYEVWINA